MSNLTIEQLHDEFQDLIEKSLLNLFDYGIYIFIKINKPMFFGNVGFAGNNQYKIYNSSDLEYLKSIIPLIDESEAVTVLFLRKNFDVFEDFNYYCDMLYYLFDDDVANKIENIYDCNRLGHNVITFKFDDDIEKFQKRLLVAFFLVESFKEVSYTRGWRENLQIFLNLLME